MLACRLGFEVIRLTGDLKRNRHVNIRVRRRRGRTATLCCGYRCDRQRDRDAKNDFVLNTHAVLLSTVWCQDQGEMFGWSGSSVLH
jgi:hypothetical protein